MADVRLDIALPDDVGDADEERMDRLKIAKGGDGTSDSVSGSDLSVTTEMLQTFRMALTNPKHAFLSAVDRKSTWVTLFVVLLYFFCQHGVAVVLWVFESTKEQENKQVFLEIRENKTNSVLDKLAKTTLALFQKREILYQFVAEVAAAQSELGVDLEHDQWTYLNSVAFMISTTTTIGYGKPTPKTGVGRFITVIIMITVIPFTYWVGSEAGKLYYIIQNAIALELHPLTIWTQKMWRKLIRRNNAVDVDEPPDDADTDRDRSNSHAEILHELERHSFKKLMMKSAKLAWGQTMMTQTIEETNSESDCAGSPPHSAHSVHSTSSNYDAHTIHSLPNANNNAKSAKVQFGKPTSKSVSGYLLPYNLGTPKAIDTDDDNDEFEPPLKVACLNLLVYIFLGAFIFIVSEDWSYTEAVYFIFTSISTVGFGDYVPQSDVVMYGSSFYIFLGLVLIAKVIKAIRLAMMKFITKTLIRAQQMGSNLGKEIARSVSMAVTNRVQHKLMSEQESFEEMERPVDSYNHPSSIFYDIDLQEPGDWSLFTKTQAEEDDRERRRSLHTTTGSSKSGLALHSGTDLDTAKEGQADATKFGEHDFFTAPADCVDTPSEQSMVVAPGRRTRYSSSFPQCTTSMAAQGMMGNKNTALHQPSASPVDSNDTMNTNTNHSQVFWSPPEPEGRKQVTMTDNGVVITTVRPSPSEYTFNSVHIFHPCDSDPDSNSDSDSSDSDSDYSPPPRGRFYQDYVSESDSDSSSEEEDFRYRYEQRSRSHYPQRTTSHYYGYKDYV